MLSCPAKQKKLSRSSKGQLISECFCDFSSFPKKQQKNLTNSALEPKKWWNQQNKDSLLSYYNLNMIILAI